ncbi:Exopolysaccharide biosynthesis protein [Clostridium acidisoli DSM 12555]|uniref:Exopolysaccharide biosynthesis protein n=1 Tax=Clostridium acidisoli DSM 12555 TaxID=1121291 RepID=A0A1W1XLB8_9CLOT|nr:phosphodiester glycosidase family protein [Clostridium acidisoli]SMC24753.1 Exopolysaccharide biosynthesis protein [Clostridium acidisoli DSM 12555]
MSVFRRDGKSTENKTNKRRFSKLKYSGLFLLFEVVFTAVTLTLIVFYGPFTNVKKTVVSMFINSGRHQYVAKWFLSDDEINKLTNYSNAKNGLITSNQKSDVNEIHVEHKNDSGISVETVNSSKFKAYFLVINDPTRVKVAYTKYLGKEGQITSAMAEDNGAVAAINGGDFADEATIGGEKYTGTGGKPIGILISNGKVISDNNGNPDKKIQSFGITPDGKMRVGNYSVNDLKAANVTDAISCESMLLINGVPQVIGQESGFAPRTAIGQTRDGSILFLAIDGRSISSLGASYEEVRNLMQQHGAFNAVALDGGSSTTMYYNGDVINNPSDAVGERYVPSIVYAK